MAHSEWMTCQFTKKKKNIKPPKLVKQSIFSYLKISRYLYCSHPPLSSYRKQPTHPFHKLACIKLLLYRFKQSEHKERIVKYSKQGRKVASAVEKEGISTWNEWPRSTAIHWYHRLDTILTVYLQTITCQIMLSPRTGSYKDMYSNKSLFKKISGTDTTWILCKLSQCFSILWGQLI